VQIKEGEIKVQQGESLKSDVDLYTNMQVFLGLFIGQIQLDDAISAGLVRNEGDAETMRRFLKVNRLTSP
jgi:SCP-2 sterol transfer family